MPTTTGLATSFITFSRPGASGGGATVTDRDGRIKWAGHNLLLASESFDSSSWTKSSAPATANAAAAPDGTTTADRLNVSASGLAYQSVTLLVGVKYKIAVWAKSFGGTNQTFALFGDNNIASANLTATATWQLFEFEFTVVTGGARNCGISTGSGNAAFDVLVWGAHLYRSDLGGMQLNPAMPAGMQSYYPTTPRNLLGSTEAFSSWTAIGTPTITANTDIAPNGLQTADTVSDTNASGYQGVRLTYPSVNGGVYTGSIYIKKTGATSYPVFQVYKDSTNTACGLIVNVAAGTVAVISGVGYAAPDAYNIVSVGDYWRVWIRVTATSTGSAGFDFYPAGSTDGTTISSSATGSTVIWGAQLSDSASLDTYVPQYGAAVTSAAYYAPRLDFDGATLAAKGLLVEELRTNVLTRTAEFDHAVWERVDITSVTANSVVAPDGTQTADTIVFSANNGSRIFQGSSQSPSNGQTATFSVWMKGSGTISINTDTYSSSGGTEVAVTLSSTWTRYTVSHTYVSPSGVFRVMIVKRSGQTATSVDVWGAQLEVGAFATSYIPNSAVSAGVTRAADVASVSTGAFPYSATEGTLVVETQFRGGVGVQAEFSPASPRTVIGSSTLAVAVIQRDGGVVSSSQGVVGIDKVTKSALTLKSGDGQLYVNGTSIGNSSGTTATAYTTLHLGTNPGNGEAANGYIRRVTYIPRRLSNAELAARTA